MPTRTMIETDEQRRYRTSLLLSQAFELLRDARGMIRQGDLSPSQQAELTNAIASVSSLKIVLAGVSG